MTNAFQPKSTAGPLRRSRPPGESELWAVFQLITDAALLVDSVRDSVVQVTPAFLKLTAHAQMDVQGHSPREFFPDLPEQTLAGDQVFHTLLNRRARPPLAVIVSPKLLDAAGVWRVFVCRPYEDPQRLANQQMERFQEALARMDLLPLLRDNQLAHDMLDRVLEIILNLFEADAAAVYRMTPGAQAFARLADWGDQAVLPEQISIADQLHLTHTTLWKPGRRVQTELHRVARINGLSYVASAPLGSHGLIVVMARQKEPLLYQEEVLQVMAGRINSLMRSFDQFVELRMQLQNIESELRTWRLAVENIQEGILFLSADLLIRQVNQAAEWMLGYSEWEMRGQAVENILIGPDGLVPAIQDALDGVPTHNLGVVSLHRRNGQAFPVEMQVLPVQDSESGVVMVGFRDVSADEEIRQRTQQLEQRAVLGEVTAVFAHEVRNPINNISTGLQLLQVKLPPNDPNQENIERLINDCMRLNHLMESVLSFSRQLVHKFEEVNLCMLLRRLLDRWSPRMTKVNVSWTLHCEENTPHVLADPRALEQVFTNLISNAVEAMSGQGGGSLTLRIALYRQSPGRPQIEVTVTDTGPGIPDEIRDRIFEPFVTIKSQGTGLGLAITKRIVTAHHGSIQVNSFPVGTVFQVLLPVYQRES